MNAVRYNTAALFAIHCRRVDNFFDNRRMPVQVCLVLFLVPLWRIAFVCGYHS